MHRVLKTPELLDIIFAYTDDATDARCTTVNKNFFEASTKSLWYKMEKIQRVFAILAPIVKVGDTDEYDFSKQPLLDDWNRFYLYASKIRCITVDDGTWEMGEVYQEVARSRTQLDLFPNLINLRITLTPISAKNAVLYLHKNLQVVMVRADTPESDSLLGPFLAFVLQRAKCLSDFLLQGNFEAGFTETLLGAFFRNAKSLKRVTLPLFTVTASVMNVLATLRTLQSIEFRYCDDENSNIYWGEGDPSDIAIFSPSIPKDSFPELQTLEFAVKLQDAKRFLSMQYAPTNITSLYIYAMDVEVKWLVDLIRVLAENCRNLISLGVDMTREIASTTMESVSAITFDLLRPLFKLDEMENFYFHHPMPLILSNADIDLLARSWTALEDLELNSMPLIQDVPGIDLSCLQSFAEHCQNLQSLNIYLDGRQTEVLPVPQNVFEALSKLSFGFSFISNPEAVAAYLSQVLDLDCELEVDENTWEDVIWNEVEEKHYNESTAKTEQWKEVKRLMPIMTKTTQKYKDTISDLKEEIRILRRDLNSALERNRKLEAL